MKLTVLVDNNTYIDQYYCGEPAACYYIEADGRRVLFDTGYSGLFLRNAEQMGIDLRGLTHIVLSHGHNDHTNGLKFLAEETGISQAELIAHPDCFLPKYDGTEFIGAPYSCEEILQKITCRLCKTPYWLSKHLLFLGEIPRNNDFEALSPIGKKGLPEDSADDYLTEDSALVCQHSDGIFIITGCSHSGICNIIEYAKDICKEPRILGVLGGFHLFEDDSRLDKTIQYLEGCQIRQLYPCHCVSLRAKAKMLRTLPVNEVGVGLTLSVP
ncbi:MAG: MBL fold metallo-hydrolase [Oscillibacter sp.]|nr:MBL fold metallo-hydrolase [Oscillibacter sp.]